MNKAATIALILSLLTALPARADNTLEADQFSDDPASLFGWPSTPKQSSIDSQCVVSEKYVDGNGTSIFPPNDLELHFLPDKSVDLEQFMHSSMLLEEILAHDGDPSEFGFTKHAVILCRPGIEADINALQIGQAHRFHVDAQRELGLLD